MKPAIRARLPSRALLPLLVLSLSHCAAKQANPDAPDAPIPRSTHAGAADVSVPHAGPAEEASNASVPRSAPASAVAATYSAPVLEATPPDDAAPDDASAPDSRPEQPLDPSRCAGVPPRGPDGSTPPAPPRIPLGENIQVPGDRPLYVLRGQVGDPRVIVYLHGMCGDITAADHFREAARAHGTLLALRGDTPCHGDRFKWRGDSAAILRRVRAALQRLNAINGTALGLDGAILFGYSQGAERAQQLSGQYPELFPRVVLGGPPMKASPLKLGRARRVAIFGGELETTETMRAGAEALQAAGIPCRYFTLECAYHGRFGTNAEAQLAEVLDWVSRG